MNKVLSVVVFLLMSIGAWAGQVTIVKNPSNGGTVTASQVGAGQTCTLTVKPTEGYYLKSLTAATTVDGSAVQAPVRRNIPIDRGAITITSNQNADPSGETTHTFTMPEDENLNVEVTAEFETLISIANATITLAVTSYTYDGTEKEPAVSSVEVEGKTLADNEFTISYSDNKNAGTGATVTVTGLRQYTGTATTMFTISPKALTSNMVTLSASSFVYSTEVPVLGLTVKDGNYDMVGVDYTISYQKVTGETTTNIDADKVKDAGTYNVVVTGQGNYTGSVTKSFAITKAPLENLAVLLTGWTFGAAANAPSVTGNTENGNVAYTYKAAGAEQFTATVPTAAGTHIVKATVAETTNYEGGEATAEFIISKATLNLTVSLAGWKYGATANAPSVTGNVGEGTVTYSYKAAGADVFTENKPTAVGTHTVKAEVAETANYQGGTATAEFAIAKGDLTMVSDSIPEELVYDGTPQQLIFVKNVPEGATAKYYWSPIDYESFENRDYPLFCDPHDDMFTENVPTGTNAGYFALAYKVFGGDNYNDTQVSQTLYVAIYPAEITEVTLATKSLPYNGKDQTVAISSVKAGDLTLTAADYTVTLNGAAVTGNITAKTIGKYTVEVTGKGNFTESATAEFSIVNRTLAANDVEFHNNWATYYSADGDVELPEGIGAFVATAVGDAVVTVSQIKNIPEKVAVLLNNQTEVAGTVAFDPTKDTNLLQHANEAITIGQDEVYYGLYNGKMMRVTGTIPAGRNYLPFFVQNAPQLTIVIEGNNTTGVNGVISKQADANGDIYDLQGRKVSNPKKGLYIQKGRKVVVNNK